MRILQRVTQTIGIAALLTSNHITTRDGRDAAGVEASSGIYFTRLEAGGYVETRKIALVR